MLRLFKYLFPLLQWHACKLAKLSACIAKCMTTINKIHIYIYINHVNALPRVSRQVAETEMQKATKKVIMPRKTKLSLCNISNTKDHV